MDTQSKTVILTKEMIQAENKALLIKFLLYIVAVIFCAVFVYQVIYKPFLTPAEDWQRRSLALCSLQLDNYIHAHELNEKAFLSTMKYQFKSLNNKCSSLLEEELKLRSEDYRYRNLHKNKDRNIALLLGFEGN